MHCFMHETSCYQSSYGACKSYDIASYFVHSFFLTPDVLEVEELLAALLAIATVHINNN